MPIIEDMFASVPGLKSDYKVDWIEDAKQDWIVDWDAIPGGAPAAAPINTVAPVLSGTAQVGQTLNVTTGTWTGNPAPTFTYKWTVDGVEVVGVTANSYVVQAGDVGFDVAAEVTGTNSEGSVPALSNILGPVVA